MRLHLRHHGERVGYCHLEPMKAPRPAVVALPVVRGYDPFGRTDGDELGRRAQGDGRSAPARGRYGSIAGSRRPHAAYQPCPCWGRLGTRRLRWNEALAHLSSSSRSRDPSRRTCGPLDRCHRRRRAGCEPASSAGARRGLRGEGRAPGLLDPPRLPDGLTEEVQCRGQAGPSSSVLARFARTWREERPTSARASGRLGPARGRGRPSGDAPVRRKRHDARFAVPFPARLVQHEAPLVCSASGPFMMRRPFPCEARDADETAPPAAAARPASAVGGCCTSVVAGRRAARPGPARPAAGLLARADEPHLPSFANGSL
jgi:hypothetical protein